jgi:sugar-specific transcriptional regulator TrmB
MAQQSTFIVPPGMIPGWVLKIMNNLYEIDRKLALHGDAGNTVRNVEKIKDAIGDFLGDNEFEIFYEDPMGQMFKETRTDLDATITGNSSENLHVVEVIKPIIRIRSPKFSQVIQKGSVVVASKNNEVDNG